MHDCGKIGDGFCLRASVTSSSLETSTSAGVETGAALHSGTEKAGNRFGSRRSNGIAWACAATCDRELSERASRITPCPTSMKTPLDTVCCHGIVSRVATPIFSWPLEHEARKTFALCQNDLNSKGNRNCVNT